MASPNGISVTRSYGTDNGLRLNALTVEGAAPLSYGYDNDGLLTSINVGGGVSFGATYDADNGLLTGTSVTGAGAPNTTWTFDGYGEIADIRSTGAFGTLGWSFAWDNAGRLIERQETNDGTTTSLALTHNDTGRLTDVFVDGAAAPRYHYEYDVAGNRIGWNVPASVGRAASSCMSGGATPCAEYDVQDRLVRYGSIDFTYNDAGQTRTRTEGAAVTTYDYDTFGNLRGVELPGGTEVTYAIDGLGRRVGRYVNGTADRFWVYQDSLNPIAQFDGAGNLQMVFVYGLRGNVPELIVMQSGEVLRVITDQVGSVRRIVDVSDGTVWQDTSYSPFGVIETETSRAGFDQPFRFAGGIWDADTRLVRFGARDYDVLTGRWTAKDPIRFDGGVNLYEYAAGAPQMYVDPNGEFVGLLVGVAIVAVGTWIVTGVGVEAFGDRPEPLIPHADHGWGPFWMLDPVSGPGWHSHRNRHQHCPQRASQCSSSSDYTRDDRGAHDATTFRGPGGSQCSYTEEGFLSNDPLRQGSFDYAPPTSIMRLPAHVLADVIPAYMFGTRPTGVPE